MEGGEEGEEGGREEGGRGRGEKMPTTHEAFVTYTDSSIEIHRRGRRGWGGGGGGERSGRRRRVYK